MKQSTRKRPRRSSDSEGSGDAIAVFTDDEGDDDDPVQVGERERMVTFLSSRSGPGSSAFVPDKGKQSPFLLVPSTLFLGTSRAPQFYIRPVTWLRTLSFCAWFQNAESVFVLGVCLPSPSVDFRRSVTSVPFRTLCAVLPLYLYGRRFLTLCYSPFGYAGSLPSPPENSGIDDVDANKRTLRFPRKVGHDGWTSTSTIGVPGACGHNPGPALGGAGIGSTSVIDGLGVRAETKSGRGNSPAGVGFYRRGWKSPRTIDSLPLGRSGGMETRVVGSPATEQRHNAGNPPGETEEEDRGNENKKWGESGKRTGANANDSNTINLASTDLDGGSSSSNSNLNPQRGGGGPIQNDRCEGAYFDWDFNLIIPAG